MLWEKRSYDNQSECEVYYVIMNSAGNTIDGPNRVSGCQLAAYIDPVIYDGCIYWATVDKNGQYIHKLGLTDQVMTGGIMGDVTSDGMVGMDDVVKLARAVAGNITLNEREEKLADVTGDGEVAMGDVVKIARFVAGAISYL